MSCPSMLSIKQVEYLLTLAPEKVTPWFYTGSGAQNFPGDFPTQSGIYEIQEHPKFVHLEPGPDFNPPTLFMYWTPANQMRLDSVDPRKPNCLMTCGGGFTWRGLASDPCENRTVQP